MSTSKGKFIVIEGGDGAGKSTQIKKLEKYFGTKVITTREPGGTPYAEAIRSVALDHELAKNAGGKTQFLLMWASRAEHMFNKVKPALLEGLLVISDRFDSSTFAYNIYAQEEESLIDFFWSTREFILRKNVPDLYIYLDLDPRIGEARLAGRDDDKNHFDRRSLDFKNKVRRGFFDFFKQVPHAIIDATQTEEKIFEDILEVLKGQGVE